MCVLVLGACDNTFEVNAEFRDIPIAYALLSPSDTAFYARVERGFISDDTPAATLAQDPSNLYYDNVEVRLVNPAGTVFNLREVDGNAEGFVREDGIFAQAPNILYKINTSEIQPLEPGEIYQLQIQRAGSEDLVTAETTLLEPVIMNRPQDGSALDFRANMNTRFTWNPNPTTVLFDLGFEIFYFERDISDPDGVFELKSTFWTARRGVDEVGANNTIEVNILGDEFYGFMAGALEEGTFERRFNNMDLFLFSGGEEIASYQNVVNANLGITSTQDIPVFTNLSEGRGLFSSRDVIMKEDLIITPATLDSLVNGSVTGRLGFQF